jgi:NAD-dependent SIR2 family protein deacetylase
LERADGIVKATDTVQEWLFDNHVDLILVIGTSGLVYPAAGYAWSVKMRGGKVAVFNIESDSDQQEDWMFEGIVSKDVNLRQDRVRYFCQKHLGSNEREKV